MQPTRLPKTLARRRHSLLLLCSPRSCRRPLSPTHRRSQDGTSSSPLARAPPLLFMNSPRRANLFHLSVLLAGPEKGEGSAAVVQAGQVWRWQAEEEGDAVSLSDLCLLSVGSFRICEVSHGGFFFGCCRSGARESKRRR
jgi:hypothetical protein